jgi:hypothetical protein
MMMPNTHEDWIRLAMNNMDDLQGRTVEDVVASGLRSALDWPDLKADNVRLGYRLIDKEGLVCPAGFKIEANLIVEDNQITVFEVLDWGKWSDVDLVDLKVQLATALNPGKEVRGLVIQVASTQEVEERCAELGIELVDSWQEFDIYSGYDPDSITM